VVLRTLEKKRDEGVHPSVPAETACDEEENVTLEKNENISERYDSYYQEFNDLFNVPIVTPDKQSNLKTCVRKSSRKTQMPVKLADYEVNTKIKYIIDKQVNYSKLSSKKISFSTNFNKIIEPKTYEEAASDIRLVEAMNLEMEPLNRNGT
jgi:hypothetical protein